MRWTDIGLAATLGLAGASNAAATGQGRVNVFGSTGLLTGVRDTLAQLGRRQAAGTCGASNGNQVCPGNQCCSQFGFCGESDQFCLALVGCQPDFGWCEGEPLPSPTDSGSTSTPLTTSETPTTTSEVTPPIGTLTPTVNGMCGNSTTCAGSGSGGCCSQFWWCGDGPEYCGTGCKPEFGTCGDSTEEPTTIPPTTTPPTSAPTTSTPTTSTTSSEPTASLPAGQTATTDGTCGNNVSCIGWAGGSCCSQFGFCGDGDYFCAAIAGCQPQFGTCSG